jgi:hypothetical protein
MMTRHKKSFLLVCLVWIVTSANQLYAQNVITTWNSIASNTIIKVGGMGPSPAGVYFAYAAIATYDAVNAIDQGGHPFYFEDHAPPHASQEAAAAAAAHKVLVHYFPNQQSSLDQSYQATLAGISASPNAKDEGVKVGERAANALLAARTNDGLGANVTYTPGSGPGAWQPTPPGFLAPATPWLGQMRPFTFTYSALFLPAGPPSLDSPEWQRDYIVTKTLGAKSGSPRTPSQTEIGNFWIENTAQQYARLFNNLAAQNHLSLPDTARFMGMVWTGFADAAIACFNAKYHYGFWRPVTAIPDGGGNPDLVGDAGWAPLGTTPNHPEYPAAHACLTGAASTMVSQFFRTPRVHIVVDSLQFTPPHQHTFETTDAWLEEVRWARIYSGFHFYHSVMDGGELGQKVAKYVAFYNFQPNRQ